MKYLVLRIADCKHGRLLLTRRRRSLRRAREWWTQGATKDEWTESKKCTEGINLIIYYVEWEGTRIICHDGGYENCSSQACSE